MLTLARSLVRRAIGGDRLDRRYERRRLDRELKSDPVLREHARRLAAFKNAYAGRRCVIVGNGPSLANMDLSCLRHEITFGLNRIYLLFAKLAFETTFLVSVNDYVIQQCTAELLDNHCTKFVTARARDAVDVGRSDLVLLRAATLPGFSRNPPREGVREGATVTYVAMQLAYYMGFRDVILIGVDHRFSAKGAPHTVVVSEGADRDHFDPRYFGAGFKWQLPDLEVSEQSYLMARDAFARDGRTIVDATLNGALTIFPKAALADALKRRA